MKLSVYMVLCRDGSLYTGVSVDPPRRTRSHNGELSGGAKYTRSRRPVVLVWERAYADPADARREETRIKRLSRAQKMEMIQAMSPVSRAQHEQDDNAFRFVSRIRAALEDYENDLMTFEELVKYTNRTATSCKE